MMRRGKYIYLFVFVFFWVYSTAQTDRTPDIAMTGFETLFNGHDFTNWIVPEGDNGHWKVIDGVIDYDAESEAPGNKSLWTEKEYKDFILYVDWRIKETPFMNPRVPIILPNGDYKLNEKGEIIYMVVPDADSGIYFRGVESGSHIQIFCWPVGSGEVRSYRTNKKYPPAVRTGVTPKLNADNNIGEWNRFKITLQKDFLTVVLNEKVVVENAYLPNLHEKGAIGLQHYGRKVDGKWVSSPSLLQFKNIYIKEL